MRALGRRAAEHVTTWAETCLTEGLDSASLRICAGLSATTSSFEADGFLTYALRELGVTLPSTAAALERYVAQVAIDVVEDRCSAAFAVHEISAVASDPSAPSELGVWRDLDEARFDLDNGFASYVFQDLTQASFEMKVRDAARELLERLPL